MSNKYITQQVPLHKYIKTSNMVVRMKRSHDMFDMRPILLQACPDTPVEVGYGDTKRMVPIQTTISPRKIMIFYFCFQVRVPEECHSRIPRLEVCI